MKKTLDISLNREEAACILDALERFKNHEYSLMTTSLIFNDKENSLIRGPDKKVEIYKKLMQVSARFLLEYNDQFSVCDKTGV